MFSINFALIKQEAGIPIDLVGGTSIGSFMGALWADETRVAQFTQRARNFTNCFNSIWKKIKDFTYPAVSIFSGKNLNYIYITVIFTWILINIGSIKTFYEVVRLLLCASWIDRY